MTVEKLISELKKWKINKELEVRMFAHDHEPKHSDEGDGPVRTVDVVTNDKGETFVCLHA